jgi:DNA-binding protein H-NS
MTPTMTLCVTPTCDQSREDAMARMNGLDKMSYAELAELRDRVNAAMTEAKMAEKDRLRAEMEAMATKAGLSLTDVVGTPRAASKAKAAKAFKYRNPENPSEVWSGRGRRPMWLIAALKKKGQKLENFEV